MSEFLQFLHFNFVREHRSVFFWAGLPLVFGEKQGQNIKSAKFDIRRVTHSVLQFTNLLPWGGGEMGGVCVWSNF